MSDSLIYILAPKIRSLQEPAFLSGKSVSLQRFELKMSYLYRPNAIVLREKVNVKKVTGDNATPSCITIVIHNIFFKSCIPLVNELMESYQICHLKSLFQLCLHWVARIFISPIVSLQIAHFKIPRYIKFVKEFPMTVSGKVQKYKMREMMAEEFSK